MSSLLSGSSASIDTQLPTSTTFLNTSSTINKPSDIPPLSSSSIISSEPTKGSSDDVALDVAPSTAQSATTQTPSTTASDLKAEETVGNSPITSAQGASLTADGETPIIAFPTASSDSSQTSLISPTSILPTTSSIPTPSISTQLSSSTPKFFPQISTVTTVSTGAVPTAAPSSQTTSTITISSQTQIQAAAFQSSPARVSPASGTEIGKESPSPTSSKSSSTTPSQVQSSVAQPTDESVQGPQVFSAAAVAPPPESSASSSAVLPSSTVSIQANNISSTQGQSQVVASQPANPAISAPQGAGVSNTPISTPASTPASTPISTPTSISSSTSDAGALSVPTSTSSLPPASTPTMPLSDSILSEIPSNTVTDIAPSSTGSFAAFPTGINTLPGDFQESGLPGSQATGQPVADPVGSSSRPSTGAIVGGTVGGIAAAAVIVILLWFWRKKIAGERRVSSKAYTEKDSSKPMAQRLGVSTTINAVKKNIGEKFAPRNVNMNRGNSQFLEADAAQPRNVAPMRTGGAQNPAAAGRKPKGHKLGPGLSFDFGRRFNPFSDANALMSGTVPPPSSSVLSNPFSDDNMVLPPPVSASTRRSRGRSLGGIRSFHAPTVPPRPHSVHRESLQSNDSFIQRRDKFRSDPFDLELESRLAPPPNGTPSRSSSVYSSQGQQNPRDSYTSKYMSGSSLGDWTAGGDVGSGGPSGRRDSPTIS
ncbi:Hypothetical protein TRIVIDRAFT_64278 [Trichoderma virens Gv29-8]|uniref:Uncharacterized protein n=1 Tax=Hypocrea virens (strain Gv29-8 / FGSC 10586) TaxID=413071 RepID=G9MQK0_HYPVG|nr:Hypothetical protein TRIVIDRAFT_64278 [Trichoderma virens Gv29-8]EHK23268.1 Hypothetical protein TRIVIDRAFT_64278 [Trichoderma virens Gv29-8]UKZ49573.1 hypothetical protein TrVGV298_003820 [Trichoderma virens]